MKRADVLLISIVLIAALAFLVPRWVGGDKGGPGKNLVANITVDGKLFKSVQLTEEEQSIEIRTERGITCSRCMITVLKCMKRIAPIRCVSASAGSPSPNRP